MNVGPSKWPLEFIFVIIFSMLDHFYTTVSNECFKELLELLNGLIPNRFFHQKHEREDDFYEGIYIYDRAGVYLEILNAKTSKKAPLLGLCLSNKSDSYFFDSFKTSHGETADTYENVVSNDKNSEDFTYKSFGKTFGDYYNAWVMQYGQKALDRQKMHFDERDNSFIRGLSRIDIYLKEISGFKEVSRFLINSDLIMSLKNPKEELVFINCLEERNERVEIYFETFAKNMKIDTENFELSISKHIGKLSFPLQHYPQRQNSLKIIKPGYSNSLSNFLF